MFIIRTVFRLITFIIAIAAIVIILGVGYWAIANQADDSAGAISVGSGAAAIDCVPQGADAAVWGPYLQWNVETLNTPATDNPATIPFAVAIGENAVTVSRKLFEQGFITDAELFRRFLSYCGLDATLEAGDYNLRRNMTMPEIAAVLQKANFEEVVITIPEGWRAEQIAELLNQAEVMDSGLFLGVVRQGTTVQHPLLVDRVPGTSYEGYLFPDTYRLAVDATPEDLIIRMLDNMALKLPDNVTQIVQAQGRSFFEVLIIASIVEREAVVPAERPRIASVYLNRIEQGMYLQADPTVQYAMGYQPETAQWWKTPVTLEEYQNVDSPYNTYLYDGIPPGPISNPGADSIMATLNPEETDYLFFMGCGDEGEHLFATDFATHEVNVANCSGR